VTFETGKLPEPYRSTLENYRKLSATNRLLKRSYLDNWVANHRTLGYGDIYPVTIPGKLLAGALAILGLLYTSLFMVTVVRKYARA
jgi:hypothetical protein